MKKAIILCLIAGMLLLSGCSGQQTSGPDPEQTPADAKKDSDMPSLMTLGYTEDELASVIFSDLSKGISVDVSANKVLKAGLMSAKYDPHKN